MSCVIGSSAACGPIAAPDWIGASPIDVCVAPRYWWNGGDSPNGAAAWSVAVPGNAADRRTGVAPG